MLDRLVCNQEVGGSIPLIATAKLFAANDLFPCSIMARADSLDAQRTWRWTRISDRAQAIIAHEIAEHEYGGDHELALIAGSETKLAISREARELLKKMEAGWRGT